MLQLLKRQNCQVTPCDHGYSPGCVMGVSKKVTLATFKSFVRHNLLDLQVNVKREFDGMTDGCESRHAGFVPAEAAERIWTNNLGISGIWLVGGSRDRFRTYYQDGYTGIEVYNSCGHFIVAVRKGA